MASRGSPPRDLDDLYRSFYLTLVRRATWRFGLSADDAAEIVHDAFVLAISRVDFDRNPKAWIYTVVDRLAANCRRKSDRRAKLLARFGTQSIASGSVNSTAEDE